MARRRASPGRGIADVAKAVGVSPSTVSRAFNGKPYVKDEIRAKILQAARKLGYRPRSGPRRSDVAIVVEGLAEESLGGYRSMMIVALSAEISARGHRSEIIPVSDVELVCESFALAAVALVSTPDASSIEEVARAVPVVAINNDVPGCHVVATDHAGGVELAVDHLAAAGHRSIGMLLCDSFSWGSRMRVAGYRRALKRNKCATREGLTQYTEGMSALEALARIVKLGPSALIVGAEDLALPACHALSLLGRTVPDDISVVSFEHPTISQYLDPPHTTVSQGPARLARAALDTVEAELEGADKRSRLKKILMPNELIERESVRPADPDS